MAYQESFDIISFHSRQHAFYFKRILQEEGYPTMIMSTPKEVAIGCGLSLRFPPYMTPKVIEIYKKHRRPIIGFYHVERTGNRSTITRIPYN